MKRKDEFGVWGSIFLTIVFACMAIFTYQTDKSNYSPIWIPVIGVIVGIVMIVVATIKVLNRNARKEQQENFSKSISYDSNFGNGDLTLYFNSSNKSVTICATTTSSARKRVINDFVCLQTVETDNYIVSLDSTKNKVISVHNKKGEILLIECCINEKLKAMNISLTPSTPSLKAFNNYAFITDDVNEFIAIVTPSDIYVLRYSDIVTVSYEENGSEMYNKSIGGAVVGGLFFGSVGAIVGGSTAKTKQNKEVRKMAVKILLKSTSNSTISLSIYEAGKNGSILETKNYADSVHYENLMKEVSDIKDIFSIIIDIVDKNLSLKKSAIVNQPQVPASIADELMKLAKLKESGILTEDEFNKQKAKLLN